MTATLKKAVISKKFGLRFPENRELNMFKDEENRIYVEHPTHKNVWIAVSEKNVKEIKEG